LFVCISVCIGHYQGQRKANERVEERKQRLNLPDTLMEDEPYYTSSLHGGSLLSSPGGLAPGSSIYSEDHRGRDLTKDQLAESRREARERYLQKQKQEDALAEANFKAERELQDAIKKQMDEKAKKLQEITTERVAKYKVCVYARLMLLLLQCFGFPHSVYCSGHEARAGSQGEGGQGASTGFEEREGPRGAE
jgi:hypothetical protein